MAFDSSAATFTGLIDLAGKDLGGRVVGCSDDFFAEAENMIAPGRATFIAGKYTDRGKWMDGWESRRKRGPGNDSCVLELGAAGEVLGFDVDTSFFVGNHPPFASIEGVRAPRGTPMDELAALSWRELLPQSPLRPDAQNLFAAQRGEPVSHVRLHIYPDGGVARFRVYGRVAPDFSARELDEETAPRVASSWIDLAALKSGGRPLACSDAFFGPMHNLLAPGRAADMGGGWETRRKRAPGHDWILIELGSRGRVKLLEVDTNHFKGNYPDRCAIDLIDAPGARITELIAAEFTSLLPEVRLGPSARHFYDQLASSAPATHLRLRIFPDGGVSRLRAWGLRDD